MLSDLGPLQDLIAATQGSGAVQGNFPVPGLSLDAATGIISGTPTLAGTYSFTVVVTDSASATATKTLTITVGGGLDITTTSLPAATVGSAYSVTLAAAGGS